nr:rhodanese-like domain-containing protein [Rhizobiaceae bacterium]
MRRTLSTVLFPAFALALASSGSAFAAGLDGGPLVTVDWLEKNIANPAVVVIDVRDPVKEQDAYKAGHIAGSVPAAYEGFGWRTEVNGFPGMLPPVEQVAGKIGSLGIDNSKHVVIVSDGADSTEFGKATRVYWTFKVLGHDAVSILD